MERFVLPDENTVISAKQVVDIIQSAQLESRRNLLRSIVRGRMSNVSPHRDRINILEAPESEFLWNKITRSSIPYVPASVNGYTYHLYRDGSIEPQGNAKKIRDYPPIASYLLNNKWPYTDGSQVTIGEEESKSISDIDVAYASEPISDKTFHVNVEELYSYNTLCLLFPFKGDCELSVSFSEEGGKTWGNAKAYDTEGEWEMKKVDVEVVPRIPYGHGELTVDVSFSSGSGVWGPPALVREGKKLTIFQEGDRAQIEIYDIDGGEYVYGNGYAWGRALPDGRILSYVQKGAGITTGGIPISIPDKVMIGDGAAPQTNVISHFLPTASVERPVTTGRDKSQVHNIKREHKSYLRLIPELPSYDNLPIATLTPSRTR